MCETCEKNGRGGYAPSRDDDNSDDCSSDDSDSDSDGSTTSSSSESDAEEPVLNLNERRTRRGVYAVSKPNSDSSDESDDGEDDNTKPLADAADIPGEGEIELTATGSNLTPVIPSLHSSTGTTSTGRNPSTPISIRSPSLTEPTPSSSGPSATSDHSTPFRSIISTRSQKAREVGSKSLTPLKESSRCASVDTPTRLTRSVSLLQLSEKSKGKASPVPSLGSSVLKQARGSGKDAGRNGDGDALPARTRSEAVKESPAISEVPRGFDGKPLPTCVTCSNVLPLISIDSKVVWGLETGKRDKNTKRECPRYVPGSPYLPSMVALNDSIVVYVTLRSMMCHGHVACHQGRQPLLERNQPLRTSTRRM